MKGVHCLRISVLVLATYGAGLFWGSYLLAYLAKQPLLFYSIGELWPWWWGTIIVCLIVGLPLSAVSLMRRDFIGAFGLLSAFSLGLGFWLWTHMI